MRFTHLFFFTALTASLSANVNLESAIEKADGALVVQDKLLKKLADDIITLESRLHDKRGEYRTRASTHDTVQRQLLEAQRLQLDIYRKQEAPKENDLEDQSVNERKAQEMGIDLDAAARYSTLSRIDAAPDRADDYSATRQNPEPHSITPRADEPLAGDPDVITGDPRADNRDIMTSDPRGDEPLAGDPEALAEDFEPVAGDPEPFVGNRNAGDPEPLAEDFEPVAGDPEPMTRAQALQTGIISPPRL